MNVSQLENYIKCNTIFLDRDGVINSKIPNNYVKNWNEFHFLPHALEALKILSVKFEYIFIVTNQRGVGKGLMTEYELKKIHEMMLKKIILHGGRISKIYYSTSLSDEDNFRKPNIGMALQAKCDYPKITFKESIMVGDSETDVMFGLKSGMNPVLINPTIHLDNIPNYKSLFDFAINL